MLLLFLEPTEKQVEQAFGGRFSWREPQGKSKRAGEDNGGNGHLAAAPAQIGQLHTQRLPHPTLKQRPGSSLPGAVDISAGW